MSCLKPEDPDRRASKDLDKRIAQWMKEYDKAIKLLLLGAGESGKTTILKQMRILHLQGFSEKERQDKVQEIRRNVLQAIKELTANMRYLRPPVTIANPENLDSLDFIHNLDMMDNYTFPQEFYEHVKKVWADEGVQECYGRSNEFSLIDSAKYFLDKIDEIRDPDYKPSDQDILCCRIRTSEIQKIEFQVKVPKKYGGSSQLFWMFDVGGQRGERRKWIQVFDGITAILFLVSSSGFDMKLREDNDKNRMKESLELFQDVWSSSFPMLYFLDRDEEEDNEYNKARCFIRDKFLEITRKPPTNRRMSTTEMYYDLHRETKKRDCYWHFTTATDTNNVKRVFDDIHHMILMWNIQSIAPS
ncbi:guanine nucleotide-binding protein G(s) subunit alpha-like [Limulus polyphemus]|uniref:Guanine nucleotide-binding protein G(s) subunit alpha n=1 Tax=Limulus polyphemus TaxID=6850 RepID=A0ABM1SBL2_LIMPO|nr:guanine nucleotide-binding protein G(s) subunit alpha-like [Limulus polyphemus]